MASLEANGIRLDVETFGKANGIPIVLIRGLGSQRIQWPDTLIGRLANAGLRVVTFDNRDAGLSQKFDDAPPYSLSDMAQDVIGLLDVLGIERAHMLGMSMGGMILMVAALEHRHRIRSGVVLMSSSRAADLPKAAPRVLDALRSRARTTALDDVIEHELATGRLWQSPRWPFDPAERRAMIERTWARCYCPDGAARQLRAMEEMSEPSLAAIERIETPLLVIHGTDDTLLPSAHGRDIARRVPGARLMEIEGMGHDLEGEAPGIVAKACLEFIELVESGTSLPKE